MRGGSKLVQADTVRARRLPASAYAGLKTGTRRLVEMLGGVDAAASGCRVGRSMLSDYGNPHHDETFIPVDVALDLEDLLGAAPVSQALALARGFDLVPVEPVAPGELAALLARLGRDCADLFAESVALLNGAERRPAQIARMRSDLVDLRAACASLLGLLDQP
jgi:hypothetical protein